MSRVAELVVKIIQAKKAYYAGNPIMNDYTYDMMEMELKKLDPMHPVNFLVGYGEEYDWWISHYST
jgi:NAD-dependent DNA ligase